MKIIKLSIPAIILLIISIQFSWAQPHIKVVSGQITLDDFTPTEAKYKPATDSLDRKIKLNPNDTTALFYRAVLYLSFNSIIARPDQTTNEPADKLLSAKKMADRADSLNEKFRPQNIAGPAL